MYVCVYVCVIYVYVNTFAGALACGGICGGQRSTSYLSPFQFPIAFLRVSLSLELELAVGLGWLSRTHLSLPSQSLGLYICVITPDLYKYKEFKPSVPCLHRGILPTEISDQPLMASVDNII